MPNSRKSWFSKHWNKYVVELGQVRTLILHDIVHVCALNILEFLFCEWKRRNVWCGILKNYEIKISFLQKHVACRILFYHGTCQIRLYRVVIISCCIEFYLNQHSIINFSTLYFSLNATEFRHGLIYIIIHKDYSSKQDNKKYINHLRPGTYRKYAACSIT